MASRCGDSGGEVCREVEASHSDDVRAVFEALCRETELSPASIARVVIGAGPGSFTGLRIGYGFAKGLCLARKIPLVPVSTYAACAMEVTEPGFLVAVTGDARRGECFFAAYFQPADGSDATRTPLAPVRRPVIVACPDVPSLIESCAQECGAKGFHVVSPSREWDSCPVPAVPAEHIARGLIDVAALMGVPAFSAAQLMESQPDYVRKAAAKTIAERQALR